jgi:hypothetical protein
MTSTATSSAISLRASAAGRSRSGSLAGQMTLRYGPAPAPASPSVESGSEGEQQTTDTSGQTSTASSRSACLQSRLESRLKARMAAFGSTEYELTWKHWDMDSGPPICALRASPLPIEDRDSSGWATPTAHDGIHGPRSEENAKKRGARCLQREARLAGWATASSRDWKDTAGMKTTGINPDGSTRKRMDQLPRQVHGLLFESLTAPTERIVASPHLNPAFSRWLMGFPAAWDEAAPGSIEWESVQRELTAVAA